MLKLIKYHALFLVLILSAGSAVLGEAPAKETVRPRGESEVGAVVEKAEKLLSDGKYKQSIEKLEKAISDARLAGSARGYAVVLLARALRLDGRPAESVRLLEKHVETKSSLHGIELGEAYLALQNYEEAIRAASFYGSKDAPEILARAHWIRARAEFALATYLQCIGSCKEVIGSVVKYGAQTGADRRILNEMSEISKKAEELMERAQELYDAANYGRDFAFYRKARKAEFSGRYDEAIKNYGLIRSGILFQAAALYSGRCLKAKGETKEALAKFKEIVENDPSSPYAGEAVLELAEDAYVGSGAEEALKHIFWFDGWIAKELEAAAVKGRPDGINLPLWSDVVEKSPKKYLDADEFGNLVRTVRMPESIVNGRTSPWYLPFIRTRAAILKGHFAGELGEKAEAAEIFRNLPAIGGDTKVIPDKGTVDVLLKGLADGFPCPLGGESAKRFRRERKNALALACLGAATGDSRDIVPALEALAAGAANENRKFENRAVLFCLAYYQAGRGDLAGSEKTLRQIVKEKQSLAAFLDDQIEFLLAGLLARDPGRKDEAMELYGKIADRKGDLAPSALLSKAVMLANLGNADGSLDACAELIRDWRSSPHAAAAATLANAVCTDDSLKKKWAKSGIKIKGSPEGELIHHVRTVVIPGGADWELPPDGLKAADIVQYNIRCLSRDRCSVIKSFAVKLNPQEPQPPRSKTNEIVFYRAPLLSQAGLSCDFEKDLAK